MVDTIKPSPPPSVHAHRTLTFEPTETTGIQRANVTITGRLCWSGGLASRGNCAGNPGSLDMGKGDKGVWRWCQTNSNQSQYDPECVNLCGTKLAPLGESGGSVELEIVPAVKSAFLIEMVVDGAVNCDEFLQTSRAPEPEHGSLSSSKW